MPRSAFTRLALATLGLSLMGVGALRIYRLRQETAQITAQDTFGLPAEAQQLFDEAEVLMDKGYDKEARVILEDLEKRFGKLAFDGESYDTVASYAQAQRKRLDCHKHWPRQDFPNLAAAKEAFWTALSKRDAAALTKILDCETMIGPTESEFDFAYSPKALAEELLKNKAQPALLRRYPEALRVGGLHSEYSGNDLGVVEFAFIFARGENGRWWLRYIIYGPTDAIEAALTEGGWAQGGSL